MRINLNAHTAFVSLRRRELKYCLTRTHSYYIEFVSLRRRELKLSKSLITAHLAGSSPYGDVSWNPLHQRKTIGAIKRSSPYGDVSWNELWYYGLRERTEFVSLRRRELKYSGQIVVISLSCVRLLTETWIEMWQLWCHKKGGKLFVSLRRRELK